MSEQLQPGDDLNDLRPQMADPVQMHEPVTEDELIKRSVAPRVTQQQVDDSIKEELYFTLADGISMSGQMPEDPAVWDKCGAYTVCVLVLQNGFIIHGMAACADPKNYRRDIGRRYAREDAISKIWPLLGYELQTHLHADPLMAVGANSRTAEATEKLSEEYVASRQQKEGRAEAFQAEAARRQEASALDHLTGMMEDAKKQMEEITGVKVHNENPPL